MQFFTWFDGVFDAATDKARLVTVILSAVIAVTVVLINQRLTSRREIKSLKLEKFEAAFLTCDQIEESHTNLYELMALEAASGTYKKLAPPCDKRRGIFDTMKSDSQKLIMLLTLYTQIPSKRLEKAIHSYLTVVYINRHNSNLELIKCIEEYRKELKESVLEIKEGILSAAYKLTR